MEHPKILFYFAYNSPYSFLANTRIERVLARFTPEIEYKPVDSPRSAGAAAPAPERFRYMFEDVQRFADEYGLKLAPGPFADTRKACLSLFFAQEQGRGSPSTTPSTAVGSSRVATSGRRRLWPRSDSVWVWIPTPWWHVSKRTATPTPWTLATGTRSRTAFLAFRS